MDQADTELVQERTKIPVENVDESQVKDVEAKLDAVELAKEDDTTKGACKICSNRLICSLTDGTWNNRHRK
jgi:CRISPR/Cas system-associated exonuclease Cas4 (RecB family)